MQDRSLQRRKQQKARSTSPKDPMMGFGMIKKLSKVVTVSPLPSIEQKKAGDLTVVLLPRKAYSSQVLITRDVHICTQEMLGFQCCTIHHLWMIDLLSKLY